jgi:DNA-binding NarL/FixJ family response regulator
MAPIAFPELTEREPEIIAHIAQDWSNREIATSLVVRPKTVRNPRLQQRRKLQVADPTQVHLAGAQGWPGE